MCEGIAGVTKGKGGRWRMTTKDERKERSDDVMDEETKSGMRNVRVDTDASRTSREQFADEDTVSEEGIGFREKCKAGRCKKV